MSFTLILEVKTGSEDNPFNTWKIVKESNGIRLTDLELGSQITLYQVNGQVVHSSTASSDEVRLPLPIAGVYMISVDINQNVTTQKVVF